jgi:nucleoside diphosphate kinase
MNKAFPSSNLRIRLISVMNTTEAESSDPDTIDAEYEVDVSKDMHDLTRSIKHYLHEIAIEFHLLQDL